MASRVPPSLPPMLARLMEQRRKKLPELVEEVPSESSLPGPSLAPAH